MMMTLDQIASTHKRKKVVNKPAQLLRGLENGRITLIAGDDAIELL